MPPESPITVEKYFELSRKISSPPSFSRVDADQLESRLQFVVHCSIVYPAFPDNSPATLFHNTLIDVLPSTDVANPGGLGGDCIGVASAVLLQPESIENGGAVKDASAFILTL